MIFKTENKNVYASDAGQGLDKSKDTIVFLHGSGLSHIVWSLTEQFFSNKKYNVLSLDLPGHGNSEGPCLDSIEKIADWLEKVFMELKLDKVIIVGHSQGCLEALEYSYKYKSRLKKIIFIGGNPVEKIIQSPRDISEILAVDLIACNNYQNGSDAAKAINCPAMFIFGELDKMVNLESGKKFANLVKNSTNHIIKGSGHMIMIEKAFEMREKILEFLNK